MATFKMREGNYSPEWKEFNDKSLKKEEVRSWPRRKELEERQKQEEIMWK